MGSSGYISQGKTLPIGGWLTRISTLMQEQTVGIIEHNQDARSVVAIMVLLTYFSM